MDSHADTCTIGAYGRVIHDTGETISVNGFHDQLPTLQDIKIVTAALAYDDPVTYNTYILFFHQALYFPELTVNLLNPDQLREKGITVNDTPLIRLPADQRNQESHSIIDEFSGMHIPMRFNKPISYFSCRTPTEDECIPQETNCIHVHMTCDAPWQPYNDVDAQNEDILRAALTNETIYDRSSRHIQALAQCSPALSSPTFTRQVLSTNTHASAIQSRRRKGTVTKEQLARRWRCGLDVAERTLKKTTQRAVRDFTHATGGRRIKPTTYQLRYPRLRTPMYTDTLHGPCKSWEGNKYLAIYCTKFQWCRGYPLRTKNESHYSLDKLFRAVGFPSTMIPDNALELTQGEFRKKLQSAQVDLHPIEAYSPNLNAAEDCIRELKRMFRRAMNARNIPAVFWDRVIMWCAEVRSHMALNHMELDGEVPATVISGDTSDISYIAEFSIWDWVWYITPADHATQNKRLGRWLGPSFDVGDSLCYAVLTDTVQVVHRTSVFPMSTEDANNESIGEMKAEFTRKLNAKLGDRIATLDQLEQNGSLAIEEGMPSMIEDVPKHELYSDDDMAELAPLQEADETSPVDYDKYIATKVQIPVGDKMMFGTVRNRKRDAEGNYVGHTNQNPILDTALYEVEFEDGAVEPFYANQIADAIYARVDDDGYTMFEVDDIVDHKRDGTAIRADDGFTMLRGRRIPKRTTKGWQLCIQWKDGSTSWEDLKDVKESTPVRLAEYAVANKLVEEPAFKWWVPYTLKKRDRIIKAVKRRFHRKNEKFGLEIPNSVKRALAIDRETGTKVWETALAKEIKNIWPVFEIKEPGESAPVGSTHIDLTVVFDVKMDFTRKVRICARGDQTDPPSSITYASVVTRESIRIGLLVAALNDLDIMSADVAGAYLNADCPEKVHIICGPEFGTDFIGRVAIIKKALYGLWSSGFAWRSLCAQTLRENLGFKPCRADNDVWMRPAIKPNGDKYYEYIFVYTDDIMVISHKPKPILDKLNLSFLLKPESIGKPNIYLGATILQFEVPGDSRPKWAISSEQYVKEAVRLVKAWLEKRGLWLKSKAPGVLPSGYQPELDGSPELDDERATYYQSLIGILRWAVELGRIDICTEVSVMSSYSAMPREGHLQALFHMFAYLSTHNRSKIVMDDETVYIEPEETPDFSEFYPFAKDVLPEDMPEIRGKAVQLTMFVDASHAANMVTRQSRTGVLIYVNRAPVLWYSKKQNSIETSTFGSEFMALKTGMELLEGVRYKLRMMGIEIDGHAHVRVDNMSVVNNSSIPESTLKKKSNSIAYHYVRSKVAADIARIAYEPSESNLADMLTKIQPGPVRQRLARQVLY